jgi:hypothetical protein
MIMMAINERDEEGEGEGGKEDINKRWQFERQNVSKDPRPENNK